MEARIKRHRSHSSKETTAMENTSSSWHRFNSVFYNKDTSKIGIGVVQAESEGEPPSSTSTMEFKLKDNEMYVAFDDPNKTKEKSEDAHARRTRKTREGSRCLLAKIAPECADAKVAIYNKRHREDIYIPLILDKLKNSVGKQGSDEGKFGLYVHAWLSNPKDSFEFTGFDQFVTAGCMIGPALRVEDSRLNESQAIKPYVDFYREQLITKIFFSTKKATPYEEMLFRELEMLTHLINQFSSPGKQKVLFYHLPNYDYMLHGIELFIRGHMSYEILDQFITIIHENAESYKKTIKSIYEEHDIQVKIESPFDNLFNLSHQENVTETLLAALDISCEAVDLGSSANEEKENRRNFVQTCLIKLRNNNINPAHKKAWDDYLTHIGDDKIVNLDDLYKAANTIIPAVAAQGKENNKTCLVLPSTEKQIQITYAKHSKESSESDRWLPGIYNLTYLSPVYPANNKSLFYQHQGSNHISKSFNVATATGRRLIDQLCRNVFLFSESAKQQNTRSFSETPKPVGIDEILKSPPIVLRKIYSA